MEHSEIKILENEATSADAVEKYGAENVARMKKEMLRKDITQIRVGWNQWS